MKRKSLWNSLLVFCLIGFGTIASFISCEVGLGSAVDVAAPDINITTPPTAAVIRQSFAIAGDWSDDGTIKSLEVTLKNTNTKKEYKLNEGNVKQQEDTKDFKGTWDVIVDPLDTKNPIPDGSYEATISITDNGKHKTQITRSFVIDNTPPVVVLQRPSSKAGDSISDLFGQTLSLTGQAADDNNIKEIHINFYSDPECTDKLLDNPIIKTNIPPTISLDVAKFEEDSLNDYAKIYGSIKKEGKKPPVYYTITAYDEAQRFPITEQDAKEDDSLGNATDTYYLYDDIYADVLADFKVTNIYSILNGSFTDSDASRAASAQNIPEILKNYKIKAGKFQLNPANNPEFKVVGREGLEKDENGKLLAYNFANPANDLTNESNITVKIDVGLDAIPLNIQTLRVYLLPVSADGSVDDKPENRIYPEPSDPPYEKNGTGYTFTTKIIKDACKDKDGNAVTLTVGNPYVIAIEGYDSMRNEAVAEEGKVFGFRLAPNGAAPILDINTSINSAALSGDSMLYVPRFNPADTTKITSLKFEGTVTVEDGEPTVEFSLDGKERQTLTITPTGSKGEFSFATEITVDDFVFENATQEAKEKSGQHNITFYANQTQDATPVKKTLMYQVDGPKVTLSKADPTAYNYYYGTNGALVEDGKPESDENGKSKKYLNGKNATLPVTIIAGAVGLDETEERKPVIEFIQNGEVKLKIDSPTFESTDPIDTTKFADGELLIRITAYDLAGNKGVKEETYYVDQYTDKPVILPKNPANSTLTMTKEEAQSLENTSMNVYSATQGVAYKLIDDDGLIEASYVIRKASAADQGVEVKKETINTLNGSTDYQLDINMPEDPGTYLITINTKDKNTVSSTGTECKENTKSFFIRVTSPAPVIESVYLQSTYVKGSDTISPQFTIKSEQVPFILFRVVKNNSTNSIVSEYSKIYTYNAADYTIKENLKDLFNNNYGFDDAQNPFSTIAKTELNSESPVITDTIEMSEIPASGKYVIYYLVIDKNDKYGEATKDITVDLNAPNITNVKVAGADYDAAKWYGSKTLALDVTAADLAGETGISAVEYSTNGTTWTALSYDNSTAVYAGSAVFNSEGASNDLYIRAKDVAGNITYFDGTTANGTQTSAKINVKIDTSAPVLKVLKYKVGDLAEKDIDTSKIYVKDGVKLKLSGTYIDAQSDIDKGTLSFNFGTMPVPTITTNDDSWTAEYTIDSTKTLGELTVKIKNKAGVETEITPFEVIVDTQYPEISNIALITSSTTNFVYKKNATEYYVNNTKGNPKFTISGISKDNTGIAKVNLYVGDSTTPVEKTTSDFTFDELDWKDKSTDLTVKITATDIAGNENPVTGVDDKYKAVILTIHFDTTPPAAKHWADTSNKDIYFRIGNADNDKVTVSNTTQWETGDPVNNTNNPKNQDVGKKYSYGSWGTDSSIEIRGTFDETGSGLKAIHYAIFDTEPDPAWIEKLVKGTLVKTDSHVLNVSSFAPLASNETRKVPYSTTSGRSAEDVISNFRESIPGFNVEENYLVLVAEDNVGNRKADALDVYEGSTVGNNDWNKAETDSSGFAYYKMNKDNTPPEITSVTGAETTKNTNVALTVNINEKNPSYLDVVIKKNGTALTGDSQKPTIGEITGSNSTYTSTVTIPFASGITTDGTYDVEIKVVDKAGNISAAVTKKIIRDNVAPTISFTQPSAASDAYIKSSNYTFKGKITETGSGIDEVKATLYKVDGSTETPVGEPETIYPNASGEWEWQRYDLDAKYKVKIQAKDKAGNTKNGESNSVNIDAKNPTVTVKSSGLKDADGNDVAETTALSNGVTYYAKGSYPITVTVDDINFDYDYEYTEDGETKKLYSVTGKNINDSTATHDVTTSKTSAKVFKFNPSTYADGTFSYTIDVKDKAGNQADRIVIKVQRDTTGPAVTIKKPANDITNYTNALDDESYTFRINATDGAGVGVAKLSYAFSTNPSAPADTAADWKEIDFSDGDYNIEIPLIEGKTPVKTNGVVTKLCEGEWYLYAKAADKSGNKTATTQKRQIHIDKSAPALALTGTSASLVENSTNVLSDEVTNNKYKLTGTVSDTNKLASSNSLIIKIDGVQSTITPSSGTWTKEIATGTTNGTLKLDKSVEIELIAEDIAGKKTTKKYYLYYDTKTPVLTVTAPALTESVETPRKVIKGTVSDDGYGINKVEYTLYKGKVTASTTNPVAVKDNNNDVNSTNFPIEVKGEQWSITDTTGMPLGTAEGELTLKVTATENANGSYGGRTTTDYVSFYYDKFDPNLTETGIDTTGKTLNTAFTLTGKVWDTNAIKSITVICGDKTWVSGTDSNVSITANTSTAESAPISNNWTASFVVGSAASTNTNTSNPNNISDNTNLFTVVAEDIAGKKVQLSRTVIVDTVNPTVDSPTVSTTATNSWYKTRTLELSGSVSDTAPSSGLAKVEASADNGTNWTPLSINGTSYSGSITFSADGSSKEIKVRATDVAGNTSTQTNTGINIDTVSPTLTENLAEIKVNGKDATKTTLTFNVTEENSGIQASGFTVYLGNTLLTLTNTAAGGADTTDNRIYIGTATGSGSNKEYPVTIQIGKNAFTNLSGTYPVKVTVTDKAGNPSASTIIQNINVDRDAPVPSFTSHAAGAVVNKTITIGGRITDTNNSAIKSITLTATSGSNTKQFAYPAETGKGTITYENGQWSATLDTTELYNQVTSPTANNLTLTLTATDEADNTSSEVSLALKIDQNSDRPVVKFTNLVKDDSGKYILKYGNAAALEGTITDDDATSDAVVKTFIASSTQITSATATPSGTTSFNPATGDYTFTPASPADGAKAVYFYIVDNNNNVFYTTQGSQLTRPYKQYKTDAKEDNASAITYNSDSNAPLINSVQLQAYTAATGDTQNGTLTALGTNCIVGGTSKNFVDLKVSAKDANGVKGIVIKVEQGSRVTYYRSNNSVSETGVTTYANTGTVAATTNDSSNHEYTTSRINITSYVNGQVTVTVKVYDNSGLYNNQESVFVIDRDPPTLSIDNNVAEGQVVYGINKITIGGSATATDVDKIYYAVTNDTTASNTIAAANWIEVEGQKISASIIFGGSQADAEYGLPSDTLRKWMQTVYSYNDEYMTEHDENKPLTIHFKAVDACGNAGYSSRTVSVVPNGDKPVITLRYPVDKAVNTPPSLAGTIRIYGNAEVITGNVAAVYVQIDTDYDGTFDENWKSGFDTCIEGKNTSYTTGTIGTINGVEQLGIKAVGTDNWNLPINANKEFNPTEGTRRMAIRIYGVGGSTKVSEPVIQEFTIDPNAPHIGGTGADDDVMQLKLVQFDSTNPLTADMTYTQAQAAISNQMPYVPGQTVWVKGQWYIAASVYDDSGINSIKLDENISGIDPIYLVKVTNEEEPATIQSDLAITTSQTEKTIYVKANDCRNAIKDSANNPITGKNNFDIYIPLPTSTGSGSLTFTLEAVEASEHNNGSTETVKVNFDNTPPKLGTIGHDNYSANAYNVHQDNGFYRLFGYATDAEGGNLVSDMKAVAFYFVRRGTAATNPVTKVYDPMWKNKSVTIQTGTTNTTDITYEYGMFWNTKTVGRNNTDLSILTLTTKDDNIHAGGFVLMGGTIYTIRSVSSDGLTITLKTDAPAGITQAKFAYAMVIDNFNMTESEGTGNTKRQKITDDTAYGYGYYGPDLTADDGDLMMEKWASGQWEAWINSANIPDGPIEIHYVALDNAQNYSVGIVGNLSYADYKTKTTLDVSANGDKGIASNNLISGFDYIYDANKKAYVSNNAPRITSVMLGTDLNDDNKYAIDKEFKTFWYSPTESGGDTTRGVAVWDLDAKIDDTNYWVAKKDLVVVPEFVGGTGKIYYKYSKSSGDSQEKLTAAENGTITAAATLQALVSSDPSILSSAGGTIRTFTASKTGNSIGALILKNDDTADDTADGLGKIGTKYGETNSTYTKTNIYRFSFWDSTEEAIVGQNSQWSVLNATFKQDLVDEGTPSGTITPFYWKSAGNENNSIVYSGTPAVAQGHIELEDDLPATTFNSTTDKLYDKDPKVSGKIKIEGDAFDETRLGSITVQFANKTATATYSNSTWTYSGTTAGTFELTVTDKNGPTQSGHSVQWTLLADTSKVVTNKTAATEQTIKVTVTDASSNTSTPGATQTGSTKTGYYKVDIVPYITSVTTKLSNMYKAVPSVYSRTSVGKYAVQPGETIYIEGFNIAAGNTVSLGTALAAGTETNAGKFSTTVSNTASGKLTVTANNVTSLNNDNKNDAKGSYAESVDLTANPTGVKSIYDNYYNRQPNGINNNLLTDDVELDIWDIKTAVTPIGGTIKYPNMKINPATGMPGFSFANAVLYFSMPGTINNGNTTYSQVMMESCNGGFTNNNFCWDSSGRSYGAAMGTDTGWPLQGATFQIFSRTSPNVTGGQQGYNNQAYANRIESLFVPLSGSNYSILGRNGTTDQNTIARFSADPDRITSPSLAASVYNNTTTLHVAYYDRITRQIRYRSGNITNNNTYGGGSLNDYRNTNFTNTGNGDGNNSAPPDSIDVTGEWYSYGVNSFNGVNGGTSVTATGNTRIEVVANNPVTGARAAYSTSVDESAGEYLDLGLIDADKEKPIVVIAWYNGSALKLSWEDPSDTDQYTTLETNTVAVKGAWHSHAVTVEESGGQHVQLRVDPDNGIHLAYYVGGDIHYSFYRLIDTDQGTKLEAVVQGMVVDSYDDVGAKCTLGVTRVPHTAGSTTEYDYIPYIGYQRNVHTAKIAYPVKFTQLGTTGIYYAAGPGAINDMFTDNWAVETVPTTNTIADYKVSADIYTNANTKVRSKTPSNNTQTYNNTAALSGYPVCKSNQVWGNNTENPIVAYAVTENGALEMAQKK